jgi:hypothetical protein
MKNTLLLVALFAALGVVAVGLHTGNRTVGLLAVTALGVFGIGSGLLMIVRREATIPRSEGMDPSYERHRGLAAVLMGVFIAMISLPFAAVGAAALLYGDAVTTRMLERLAQSHMAWGSLVVAVGAGFIMFGLTRVLTPPERLPVGRLRRWPRAINLFVVGGLLTTAGVMHALLPGTLSRIGRGAMMHLLELVK